MPDLLIDAIYLAMIVGLVIGLVRLLRFHSRRAAAAAQREAELHRDIAALQVELAQVSFGDEDYDIAQKRLEMADANTAGAELLTQHAASYTELAAFPVPRWLQRRRASRGSTR